jgi:hypothetical protein
MTKLRTVSVVLHFALSWLIGASIWLLIGPFILQQSSYPLLFKIKELSLINLMTIYQSQCLKYTEKEHEKNY